MAGDQIPTQDDGKARSQVEGGHVEGLAQRRRTPSSSRTCISGDRGREGSWEAKLTAAAAGRCADPRGSWRVEASSLLTSKVKPPNRLSQLLDEDRWMSRVSQ